MTSTPETASSVRCKQPEQKFHRPVVSLGYQAKDGSIVVTDVLCMNFPDMTQEEMAVLSWKLEQWSRVVTWGNPSADQTNRS